MKATLLVGPRLVVLECLFSCFVKLSVFLFTMLRYCNELSALVSDFFFHSILASADFQQFDAGDP